MRPRPTNRWSRRVGPAEATWRSSSQHRDLPLFGVEAHRDLMEALLHRHDLVQVWVEVVPEHGGPRGAQVQVGVALQSRRSDHFELFTRARVLDDARHAGNPSLAEKVGAMAAVAEDQTALRIHGVEKVGTEAHRDPHNA